MTDIDKVVGVVRNEDGSIKFFVIEDQDHSTRQVKVATESPNSWAWMNLSGAVGAPGSPIVLANDGTLRALTFNDFYAVGDDLSLEGRYVQILESGIYAVSADGGYAASNDVNGIIQIRFDLSNPADGLSGWTEAAKSVQLVSPGALNVLPFNVLLPPMYFEEGSQIGCAAASYRNAGTASLIVMGVSVSRVA